MNLSKHIDILLCFPPAYDTLFPSLGMPLLTGYLKSKGIDIKQVDLNLEFNDYSLSLKNKNISIQRKRNPKNVFYMDSLKHNGAQGASYEFERFKGCSFAFTEHILSADYLHRFISSDKENYYNDFFKKSLFARIKNDLPAIVGFSILAPSQVIPSFTFGFNIKKYFPKIKVVFGGQWISLFRKELSAQNSFNKFFDFAIYGDGEWSLYMLIQALRSSKRFESVPNLIYKVGEKFIFSKIKHEEDISCNPAPDFDGLPLRKYKKNKKKISLTYETSRGCYWNRCIFCVDLPLPKPKYREKNIDCIIRDIKLLIKKYNVSLLMISNATFSISQMRRLSKAIIKSRIRIKWTTMCRFDKNFGLNTLKLIKNAGCVWLNFGFESANQRMLNFINKGTDIKYVKKTIKCIESLDLAVGFQVMIGLPSETVKEALETITFLNKLPVALRYSCAFNRYYLTKSNYVFESPDKYGIKLTKCRKLPFRFFYPFKHTNGDIDIEIGDKLLKVHSLLTEKKIKAV
ncbi:MAG: radical SAM protein [Candidatus Gygaella obscura]|nr:radical SAM protein [Candidatus Gygaella obscura]